MNSLAKWAKVAVVGLIVTGTITAEASATQEKLSYVLMWNGMKIGTSALETSLTGDTLDITSTVHSAPWSAPFYKVDDIETSKLKRAGKYFALNSYKLKLLEGRNNWHRAVSVNRKEKKLYYMDLLTFQKKGVSFSGTVTDPLSCLYFIRQQPLRVGVPFYVDVVDRGKVNHIKVNVLRKEAVKTPAGTFRTVVISPEMSIESEGLFYAEGPTTIWLTDDGARVPVVIQKRIDNLFRNGVPSYLKGFVPDLNAKNLSKYETIRAELTAR